MKTLPVNETAGNYCTFNYKETCWFINILHHCCVFAWKVTSYKSIFCHSEAPEISRFLFLLNSNFKKCDVIMDIAAWWMLHFCSLLLNTTYFQNEIWWNTSVFYNTYSTYNTYSISFSSSCLSQYKILYINPKKKLKLFLKETPTISIYWFYLLQNHFNISTKSNWFVLYVICHLYVHKLQFISNKLCSSSSSHG